MTRSLTFSFAPFPTSGTGGTLGATVVAFVGEDLRLGESLATVLTGLSPNLIARAAADGGFRGKVDESLTLFSEGTGGVRRAVLVGIGDADIGRGTKPIDLGGRAAAAVGFPAEIVIAFGGTAPEAAAELALGFRLQSYRFDPYRTQKPEPQLPTERSVTILTAAPEAAEAAFRREAAVADGVELARSLVNEPANVLTPPEFARRVRALDASGTRD